MTEYRTGSHWGRTIVRVGAQPPDVQGRRPDDELVGVVDDPALAERICALLNGEAGLIRCARRLYEIAEGSSAPRTPAFQDFLDAVAAYEEQR
jgi:hypothetical protein